MLLNSWKEIWKIENFLLNAHRSCMDLETSKLCNLTSVVSNIIDARNLLTNLK